MLPLFLSIVGLAIDGGIVFGARRELQNVADSAARAGAMQIDPGATARAVGAPSCSTRRPRGGWRPSMQKPGSELEVRIEVDPSRVRVEAARDAPTSFLRLIGIGTVQVSAATTAEVRHGIERRRSVTLEE